MDDPQRPMKGFESAKSCDHAAPIYFLHIPETAGSTLRSFLYSVYDESEICGLSPVNTWTDLVALAPEQITAKKLITGHFGAFLGSYLGAPLRYFTLLRDPLQRAFSHYRRVLRDSNNYYHALAIELGSFSAYLRDPRTQPTVSNFILRQLAADFSPHELTERFTQGELEAHALERWLDTARFEEDLAILVDRARSRLDAMCFVGITEEFDKSLALLCEVFEWPFPDAVPAQNVDPGRPEARLISASDLEYLTSINTGDIEIYEYAKHLFHSHWDRSQFVYPWLRAFISHAQNAEDVLLHRVFNEIEAGFYVDVGANDPVGDSVTKAFYDRGWRGINIEPSSACYSRLQEYRCRDINLNIAAGNAMGTATLTDFPGTGLATLSHEIASSHVHAGFEGKRYEVKTDTLDNVFSLHASATVHFLKIDVEGYERQVLEGLSLNKYRPWVILVEATYPNTRIPAHEEWDDILLANSYRYVHFDGLNRYYLAQEHLELAGRFAVGVNQTDNYMKASELSAIQTNRRLVWESRRLTARLGDMETQRKKLDAHVAALTEWATSADTYGKSLVKELEAQRAAYAATQSAWADERTAWQFERDEAAKQIAALTEWATSADTYGKSLVQELEAHRSAHAAAQRAWADERTAWLVERDEVAKQIAALTEWATSADTYGKSLVQELEAHRSAYAAAQRVWAEERASCRSKCDELHKAITSIESELQQLQGKWYVRLFKGGQGKIS